MSASHGATNFRNRPLLVLDGDSFAHRSYHALPKSIRRAGDEAGGAIVGFANILPRLDETERPPAIVVGWDTLTVRNFRQRLFPQYQSGRHFDAELLEQLEFCRSWSPPVGLPMRRLPALRPTIF